MIEPTTDREKLIASEIELDALSKSLVQAERLNIKLEAEAMANAARYDQNGKSFFIHFIEIFKLSLAIIAAIYGAKYGFKI